MSNYSGLSGLKQQDLLRNTVGSLSGEHGDGRLRGEFIPLILGEANYELLKKIKASWDPENILESRKNS